MPKSAILKLPKGLLVIDYNPPAEVYFDYEITPKDALSRLKFLGAIAKVQYNGKINLPANAEHLQNAGIGRKSLSSVVDSVLLCEESRFKILDGSKTISDSKHFSFDGIDIVFEDSDFDIYQNTLWTQSIEEKGRVQAYIQDIKTYCKVNGEPVTDTKLEATVSDGGIGWFLGALLLKVSILQGKFELSVPILSS